MENLINDGNKDERQSRLHAKYTGLAKVLTPPEEHLVLKRLIFAASRGSTLTVDVLRDMCLIAADGGKTFNNVPSRNSLWTCRAHYPKPAFCKDVQKDHAKLAGETFNHFDHFLKILEDLDNSHTCLETTSNLLLNVYETNFNTNIGSLDKFSRRQKAIMLTPSHYRYMGVYCFSISPHYFLLNYLE